MVSDLSQRNSFYSRSLARGQSRNTWRINSLFLSFGFVPSMKCVVGSEEDNLERKNV